MPFDVLKLFAGRPLAVERAALDALAERLSGATDVGQAQERYAAAAAGRTSRAFSTTPTGDLAIVRLTGFITPDPFMAWLLGGTTPDDLVRTLRDAAASAAVIALVIDSPGGSVDLIQETAAAIRAIGAQTPIVAVARSMIASAAFWLASSCNEIVASPSAQLGSIGVLAVHYDESALNARVGIKPTYIAIPQFKAELNSDEPLTAEAVAYQRAAIEEIYNTFVQDVARGRKVTAAKVRSDFGKGRMMSADAAVRAGLADRVDTLENVITQAGARRSRLLALSPGTLAAADRDALDLAISIRRRS